MAFSLPVEHACHNTTNPHWARTCWMVMGQWLQSQRIPYMAGVTQHLLTCEEQVTKIWSTNLQCADAYSLAEVKRPCECPEEWIAELMWLNFMSVPLIKSNMSFVMYVGLYAICVYNWNWKLTQHHFLIKHWSQRTDRRSAAIVGLECIQWGWSTATAWWGQGQVLGVSEACADNRPSPTLMLGLHRTPEGLRTDLRPKNNQTRGYSGVGRQDRMFLLSYSEEGHKLLLNPRNNSGLLATEIDKLHKIAFNRQKTVVELANFTCEWPNSQLDPPLVASLRRSVVNHSVASYVTRHDCKSVASHSWNCCLMKTFPEPDR